MEELLAAASAAMKIPAETLRRSAEARAAAKGVPVEEVLRAWAGGEEPSPSSEDAAADDAAAAVAPAVGTSPAAETAPQSPEAPPAGSGPDVEVRAPDDTGGPEPEAPTPTAAAVPADPGEPEEAVTEGAVPRWLAAVFLIVPVFAVLYALFLPNGPSCGQAGRLAVDPVTGAAVNCDGSEYGVEVVNYFAIGAEAYGLCSSCHGENGGGGGNFPAFTGGVLLATFPEGTCADQVEWVRLGTAEWPESTYGATGKPVGGSGALMPGFGTALTEEELRAVVLYERVQFAGLDLDATIADCGLGEDAAADGEMAAGG